MRLSYAYDAAGRRIGLVYPDGKMAAWGYDAAGRVSAVTATDGLTTTLTRDGAGNLTDLVAPNGGTGHGVSRPRGLPHACGNCGRFSSERY